MLAKKTSKNQITLPKKIIEELPPTEYFDVRLEKGQIILRPVELERADKSREKLRRLGITEKDISEAVQWARSRRK